MIKLDIIAEDLFSKIRGRFPDVTIGDEAGNVVSDPKQARFFEFPFTENSTELGKISISLSEEDGVVVMYHKDVTENAVSKSKWFDFLKELRQFTKKRMLNFNTRDITKSNLEKRDYKYLAKKAEEDKMNESKLYGTSRVSYQDVGAARIMIKHTESVNQELVTGRTQKIGAIYIESADGERFKYPYKHLTGARAMARHVAEGGKPFDDFGKHITGLSEELNKLRKFKTYMGRSAVMAESLSEYMDVVKERIHTVKKAVEGLQRQSYYKEAFDSFETPVFEDVPADIRENWIDQLTIKQFNEELADVFPYIYKLVSEATKAKELGPDELEEVAGPKNCWDGYKKDGTQAGTGKNKGKRVNKCVPEDVELEQGFEEMMGQFSEEPDDDTMDVKINSKGQMMKADEPEAKEQKTPLGEFILSYYDKESGEFPKGETAVLTMVEKDYGEQFIEPAKAFIEKVGQTFEQFQMQSQPQQMEAPTAHSCKRGDLGRFKGQDEEFEIAGLAGQGDQPDTVYIRKPGTTPTQGAIASTLEPAQSKAEPKAEPKFKEGDTVEFKGTVYKVYSVDKDDPNTLYLQEPGQTRTMGVWAGGGDVKLTQAETSTDMKRMRELAGLR
jgi:hypothetical protein